MIASSPSSPASAANQPPQQQQRNQQQPTITPTQQVVAIFSQEDDDIFSMEENEGRRGSSGGNATTNTDSSASGTTATDVEYWAEYQRKWRSNSKGGNFSIMRLVSSTSRSSGCANDDYLGDGSDESDFNPKDYSLVFEQVLKDKECSELFLAFLKESRAEEPLEFIFACDEHKKFYTKWREANIWLVEEDDQNTKITTTIGSSTSTFDNNSSSNTKTMKDEKSLAQQQESSASIDANDNTTSTLERSKEVVENEGTEKDHQMISCELLAKQLEIRKEQITKLITKVKKEIIERFMVEQAEQELHRGPLKTNLLRNWQAIIDLHTELIKEDTQNHSITELKSKKKITHDIVNKLDPNVIFRDLYNSVHLDLQVELFPWFCKNREVLFFLKRKGEEYTRSIAVKNYTFNILDWRIKEGDIKDKIIKKEHFYFGYSLLLEDTKDWKVIRDKRGLKVSVSKQVYTFDKALASKMKLSKFSTTFDCSLEKVWNIFTNLDNQQKLDHNSEMETKECHTNVSSQDSNPFAFGVVDTVSKLPFMSTRKSRHIFTVIEEPSIDAIFMIGHSLQDDSIEKESETTFSKGFFFYLFTNLKETKQTRVEACHYSDLKLILSSRKKFWVKQYKQFDKLIKSLSLSSSDVHHNDSLNYNKILQHNKELNVSYYESWQSLKKKNPTNNK